MNIPVVLYNKDPRLEEEAFQLVLDLEPSDDLELGLTARTTVRVIFQCPDTSLLLGRYVHGWHFRTLFQGKT